MRSNKLLKILGVDEEYYSMEFEKAHLAAQFVICYIIIGSIVSWRLCSEIKVSVNIITVVLGIISIILSWKRRIQLFQISYLILSIINIMYTLWLYSKCLTQGDSISISFIGGINYGIYQLIIIHTQTRWYNSLLCELVAIISKIIFFREIYNSSMAYQICSDIFVVLLIMLRELPRRRLYCNMRDKQEHLEKYRLLIEKYMPSGLILIEPITNKLLFINDYFKKMFKCDDKNAVGVLKRIKGHEYEESELKESNVFDSCVEIVRSKSRNFSRLITKETKDIQKFSCVYDDFENKDHRILEADTFPFLWEGKNALGMFVIDITQQIENASLKAQNDAREMAISTVSHELRNPISGLLGMVEILTQQSNYDFWLREKLGIMNTTLSYMLNLLNSILDIQQMKKQKLKINYSFFPLIDVIEVIKQIFQFHTAQKGIYFRIESKVDLSTKIFADKERLVQILINLCANAIKFTLKGGLTLSIIDQGEDIYEFRVTDTGVGMIEEDIQKLFSAFGKLESTSFMNKQGVGLGLMISNTLVKIINEDESLGSINVESTYGQGTTFYFLIRVQPRFESIMEDESLLDDLKSDKRQDLRIFGANGSLFCSGVGLKPLKTSSASSEGKHNKSILIVDDSIFNVYALAQVLNDSGFGVFKAHSGIEAIAVAREHPYEISHVFMDCEMPIMDGIETTIFLRQMIQNGEIGDMQIIGASAHNDEKIIKKCLNAGMNMYLQKPFQKSEILKLLQK